MEDRLRNLMQELGNAINESLSESDRIAAAIGEIKRAGYDVFLVLEATIGFNKREEGADEESEDGALGEARIEIEERTESPAGERFETTQRIKWTSQDHKFLRALKISASEDDR